MLSTFHVGVAAMARASGQVIVDELLLDVEVYQDWLAALEGVPRVWARMDASAEDLVARELLRGQPSRLP